ncbi:hypothetical protein JW823_03745 [bacterium]|nr:hypothetical protein [candidate division CSSED10-310 bacterium]
MINHRGQSAELKYSTWEASLPKSVPASDEAILKKYLVHHRQAVIRHSFYHPPCITMTKHLQSALVMCHRSGSLVRGLGDIKTCLLNEERGLKKIATSQSTSSGGRISRILLFTRDGSDRFFRQILTLLRDFSPRVAGLQLDCTSTELGAALFGTTSEVKTVLASHKNAVHLIIASMIIEARKLS